MEKLKETAGVPAVLVEIGRVRTHAALQPRDPLLLKQRERVRQEQQCELHVHDMAALLKSDPSIELAPLALADVEGTLYVVDGHHRLKAYKRAKRASVPAIVEAMTLRQASHASKLANVTHTQLEMLPAQKRNALWHHLAAITMGGTLPLPRGVSQRSLNGRFGSSLDTVQRMLKRLPEVDHTTFPPEHCDGITGWPHWRFVCQTARSGMYQAMTPESRIRWQADKYKTKLAKLWEQFDPEALRVAHGELREEARDEDDRDQRRALEAAYWIAADDGSHDL